MAGLRPQLRDELTKDPPQTLYAAFQRAQQLDRLYTEPTKKKVAAIWEIEEEEETKQEKKEEAVIPDELEL